MSDNNYDYDGNYRGSKSSGSSRWDSRGPSDKYASNSRGQSSSNTDRHSLDGEKRKLEMDRGGGGRTSSSSDDEEYNETVAKKQKITMGFNKTFSSAKTSQEKKSLAPISIKLGAQVAFTKIKEPNPKLKKASASVAEIFNQDSDDEEEMPPEAKMRMRNIGRDTPTSAGPNSFGKTRQGFCDVKKVFERQLKKQVDRPEK